MVGVLQMGILKGLMFAVGLTLIALMHKLSANRDSVLGRLPRTENFVDVERHPEAQQIPGLLIFRPNGILFFANANRVHNRLRGLVKQAAKPLQEVLVNLEACPEMDVTSLEMLCQVRNELSQSEIELRFARVADPVRDLFLRSGFLDDLGEGRLFRGVDSGVAEFLNRRRLHAQVEASDC
jgi:SulP family sulfate permease